ncbi:MAG: imidazolonepropionase [Acidobacteria bacterium]|nr:imidazolonepropionase [Acidobacteriota bacterium]
MPKNVAVLNCSQLVTLAGAARPRVGAEMRDPGIIENGAMLIREGRIERIGTREEVEPLVVPNCEVIDAQRRIVLPGFVDAHTHPVFGGSRADEFALRAAGATYQEIAAAGGGIRSTVRQTRAASEDELVQTGKRYARWFLRSGTTTIEAKSGYGLTVEDELKMLRAMRRLEAETSLEYVPTFLGAHAFPDEFQVRRDEYVKLIVQEMLPQVAAANLAEYCDAFFEQGYFNEAQTMRIMTAAQSHGLKLRLHADQLSLAGGAQLAARLGAVTADHLEQTNAGGIAALKAANVQPVLLPASVMMIGARKYPNARAMIDAGLAVVLATDFNPGTSPMPSMLLALTLASTQMKMTPAEALTAATINAAYSLGRGHEIGSLEVGKRANFVVHDCDDWRELAYFAGIEHPVAVFSRGRLVAQRDNNI